ncbi:type II toxin-antitoxin system RelE/ParE family toxin [Micromonospora sp. RTP1Z1]|uniref:type II toxin-antitoxin system RelE/ParE family toxin n=1 Tax=Micromonospora sp. RTP1Z1 TaxID=2994043 RepID=UPI0029C96248|nr:type II toxin-antitoxin system RelE/ParE family toxin [Micromonospora sp. RTP1Z1]
MTWPVMLHPEADLELGKIPARERVAVLHAMEKLTAIGPSLGYPHTSDVRGATNLRELRPRAGRSPWRAFYRQFGEDFVIGAIGPEADVNPKGFKQAVKVAEQRLDEVEDDR